MFQLGSFKKSHKENFDASIFNSVGDDVFIHKMVEIRHPKKVNIGNHVAIDFGFFVTTSLNVGDYIHIGPYVSSIGGAGAHLELEHLCSVAAGVRFICLGDEHLGEGIVGALIPEKFQDKRVGGAINVKKFAALGTNSIVMPGITVSEGSVLGANSLLKCDTEPWTIYAGSPARPIKSRPNKRILAFAHELGYA